MAVLEHTFVVALPHRRRLLPTGIPLTLCGLPG